MKIAILGSNGMVGQTMTKYLKDKYTVIEFGRQDYDIIKDPLPELSGFDYVINCIGLIKQKTNEKNNLFFDINSKFPHILTNNCERLIHISSDCVFSGQLPYPASYSTVDPKDASDEYGQSKAQGEPGNAMILRTSVIGPSQSGFGLFEWFKNTQNDPVNGYSNHWWSGVTTLELSKIVANIIENGFYKHDLYQISGGAVSKLDLLVMINEIFSFNKNVKTYTDNQSINRTLTPTIKSSDIRTQLMDLKTWMDNEAC